MPAMCQSWLTLEIGDTSRDSTLMRGLYTFCLAKPGSITYTIPSMVSEVSAMLVDTTILRPAVPPGVFAGGACTVSGSINALSEQRMPGTSQLSYDKGEERSGFVSKASQCIWAT